MAEGRTLGTNYGRQLLEMMGAKATPEKMRFFDAWARAEGTRAAFNPFATTRRGYAGETDFNSVGVKNYADVRTGLQATYDTLLNGYYDPIVALLKSDTATAAQLGKAVANSPWGTGTGVLRVLGATDASLYDKVTTAKVVQAKKGVLDSQYAAEEAATQFQEKHSMLTPSQGFVDSFSRIGPLSQRVAEQRVRSVGNINAVVSRLAEQRAQLFGGTTQPVVTDAGTYPGADDYSTNPLVKKAISIAHQQIGKPYVWGAESPSEGGFDCSGLIDYAFREAGINIPGGRLTTYSAMNIGKSVKGQSMKPGDWLITNGGKHMVMYVGKGKVIAAPHKGEVVQYQDVSRFKGDIVDVRRLPSLTKGGSKK